MQTGLLIIAHAPLASALRSCALHVYADAANRIAALDVAASDAPEHSLAQARRLMEGLGTDRILLLTDVYGATPSNVAQRLMDGVRTRLVAGVNLPMLLRTLNYLHDDLDALAQRAVTGGTQCILQVATPSPTSFSEQAPP